MDFNRRRFLTIASAAVSSVFIPLATHGAAKEIVAATPDRYALVANSWREAMNVLPDAYWAASHYERPKVMNGNMAEAANAFTRKADASISLMLEHFPIVPSVEEVRAILYDGPSTLSTVDEEHLRMVSERLLPLTTMKSIIAAHMAPLQVKQSDAFGEFAARYKDVMYAAWELGYEHRTLSGGASTRSV